MAKRIADHQIIRENQGVDISDSEEPSVQKAPAQVLAQRKIIKPRGRANLTLNSASNPPPAVPTNPFSFASTAAAPPSTDVNAGASSLASQNDHKVRALNEKFVETLNALNKANTVASFVPLAKKYIEYYEKIAAEDSGAVKPAAAPATAAQSDSDSEPEAPKKEIKIQGPSFVLDKKPAVQKSVFGFGKKKPKPADSDSESDIEIKGPTFQFDKPKSDSVFKFSSSNTPVFSFGGASSAGGAGEKKDEKPSISFGSAESKPVFNFAAKPQEKAPEPKPEGSFAAKPTFALNAPPQDSSNKPAFSFGSKTEDSAKPSTLFSFGGSDSKAASNPFGGAEKSDAASNPFGGSTTKPAFSFGGSKTDETKSGDSKPAFSFGKAGDSNDKPAFSFGKAEDSNAKPAFSFGGQDQKTDKPSFSFTSKTEDNTSEKPAFSFGQPQAKPETSGPFSFGAKPAEAIKSEEKADKPAFSFSKPDEKKDEAPKSLFGSTEQPAFNFGGSGSAPAFSFGADKPAFSFGSSAPAFSFASSGAESKKEETTPQEIAKEEDTGGDFAPVAQLPEKAEAVNTGEEDEETLYTKRAKLMFLDKDNKESPYTTKGVGELKLLQHKETKKNRLLIRADGGFRVLLNSSISADFNYDSIGDGSLVRFPTINPNTKLIETYVLKVKTKDDGKELLDKINELK